MQKLRRITTVFEISDSEHNRKLKEIRSQYDLTSERIKTAKSAMDDSQKSVEGLSNLLVGYKNALKDTNDIQKHYEEAVRKTEDALVKNKAKVDELEASKKKLKDQLDDETRAFGENSDEVMETKTAYEQTERELKDLNEQVRKGTDRSNKYKTQIEKAKQNQNALMKEIEKTTTEVEKQASTMYQAGEKAIAWGEKTKTAGDKINKIGGKITRNVSAPVAGLGGLAMNSAREFEDAFVGVTKTVDEADIEGGYDAIKQSIRDMAKELPATHEEISKVVEVAGQLGIQGSSIMEFSRVMIDLGETTNIAAEEAGVALARFGNITGMSQDDFDRLGSTVVDLGNNFAASESEIVDMGLRLAAAGTQAGMSEPEIMGMAAGLTSLGLEAEAGGSGFSKLLVKMLLATEEGGKELEDFAKVSGMTAEEFKTAFQDDAAGAVESFLTGLGKMDESGASSIGVLQDMEISELRLRDAVLRASGGADTFTDAIKLGSEAWEENTALTEEAEKRYESSSSQMEVSRNRIKDVAIELGEKMLPYVVDFVEGIADMADKFTSLDPATQDFAIAMGVVLAAAGPVTQTIGLVTEGTGLMMKAFGKVAKHSTGLDKAAEVTGGVLSTGLAGPAVIAAGAIAAIGTAMYLADEPNRDYRKSIKNTTDAITDFQDEVEQASPIIDDFSKYPTMYDGNINAIKASIGKLEPEITKILSDNVTERTNLTEAEMNKLKEYMGLLDELNQEIAKKYEVRLKVLDKQLSEQNELTTNKAAEYIATVNKADSELTKNADENYMNKMVQLEGMLENEANLRKQGKTKEADAERKAYDELAEIAKNGYEKEIAEINLATAERLVTIKDKFLKSNEAEVDNLQRIGEIRDEEARIQAEYNREMDELSGKKNLSQAGWDREYNNILTKRTEALAKTKEEENKLWDENTEQVGGALMNQVANIILHGGEIDEETSKMVDAYIKTMAGAENGPESFKTAMEESIRAIAENEPELAAEAEDLIDNFNGIMDDVTQGRYDNGFDAVELVSDGIEDAKIKVEKAAKAVRGTAVIGMTADQEKQQTIGKNYVSGIASGIGKNSYLAERAARKLAGRIKSKFDQELEINSPSKVMEKTAKWIPVGVAEGIDKNADLVERSMLELARIPIEMGKISNPSLAINKNDSITRDYRNTIDVNVNISGSGSDALLQDPEFAGKIKTIILNEIITGNRSIPNRTSLIGL